MTRAHRSTDIAGRLLVTAVCIATVIAAQYVLVPGLDDFAMRQVVGDTLLSRRTLNITTLGLTPFVSAFVIVEYAALIVPAWRPLRAGSEAGRAVLNRRALALSFLLIGVQANAIALWMSEMKRGSVPLLVSSGVLARVALVVTLMASGYALYFLAMTIDRRGIGRGFSIVLLTGLGAPSIAVARQAFVENEVTPLDVLLPVLVVAASAWILTFHRRVETEASLSIRIREPAGGIVAITMVSAVLPSEWPAPLHLALCGAVSLILARCFHARLFAGADADRRRSLWSAILRGVLFVLFVDWVGLRAPTLVSVELMVLVVAFTALAFDVGAELRAWFAFGPLAPVTTLNSLHDVDTSGRILRAAKIPSVLRGAHHRALLHFMGPYIPVTILVPTSSAVEAIQLLAAASPAK